jgi:hypothetical protein
MGNQYEVVSRTPARKIKAVTRNIRKGVLRILDYPADLTTGGEAKAI